MSWKVEIKTWNLKNIQTQICSDSCSICISVRFGDICTYIYTIMVTNHKKPYLHVKLTKLERNDALTWFWTFIVLTKSYNIIPLYGGFEHFGLKYIFCPLTDKNTFVQYIHFKHLSISKCIRVMLTTYSWKNMKFTQAI